MRFRVNKVCKRTVCDAGPGSMGAKLFPVIQIFKTSPPLICAQYPQCIRSCMGSSNIGGGGVLYIHIYIYVYTYMFVHI